MASLTIPIGKAGGRNLRLDAMKLVDTRMLIQANSGGGKSWLMRLIAERLAPSVQTIILDPEGEFVTLREKLDVLIVGREGELQPEPRSAKLLARKLMELKVSAVIDLYDLPLPKRREFVAVFLDALIGLPRKLWRPLLVMLDEAHKFCPERASGQAQSTDAVIGLVAQGRKRGYCGILATQRLSKLHKDAAAECNNVFIGHTWLDVDQKRALDLLGMTKSQGAMLRDFKAGEFCAFGPALKVNGIVRFHSDRVVTTHPKAGARHRITPPKPSKVIRSVLPQLQDLASEAQQEAQDLATANRRIKELDTQIRRADADDAIKLAAQVKDLTQELWKSKSDAQDGQKVSRRAVFDAVAQAGNAHDKQLKVVRETIHATMKDLANLTKGFSRSVDECVAVLLKLGSRDPLTAGRERTIIDKAVKEARETPVSGGLGSAAAKETEYTPARGTVDGISLSPSKQKIVDALAWWAAVGVTEVRRGELAPIAGYTVNGHFNNMLGELRTAGVVEYPGGGRVELTALGRQLAKQPETPGTLDGLHEAWRAKLNGSQQKLLNVVIDIHPEEISVAELADRSGYTVNGHFNNLLGNLRGYGLVTKRQPVRATDLLFPSQLS